MSITTAIRKIDVRKIDIRKVVSKPATEAEAKPTEEVIVNNKDETGRINAPTKSFGKYIPRSLKGGWLLLVGQLEPGNKIARIVCKKQSCTTHGPCNHGPRVVADDLYRVISVDLWDQHDDLFLVTTDRGSFLATDDELAARLED